ncbi:peptidoglycan recognition protein family protein [Hansschlegelia sp. KR7-227]|uniref:peptidoglycan recognition protein family protein n=1 Tax=Hansschlegelia sp. KR7-227 TaxID=3400914 RepID=UPI003C0C8E54
MGKLQIAAVQTRLLALGYDLGPTAADGDFGNFTRDAALAALTTGKPAAIAPSPAPAPKPGRVTTIPATWLIDAEIRGIVVHWTAGAHKASAEDRRHYHFLIEGDGRLVRGAPSVDLNDARGLKTGYAPHTLHANTGRIGVSLCCMAGAKESPFQAGSYPMTREQWDELPAVLADLCRTYRVPVTAKTVLSHAEVQGTLGITQRGKWDIARLAFDPSVVGATAVGDLFRKRTAALLEAG